MLTVIGREPIEPRVAEKERTRKREKERKVSTDLEEGSFEG